LNSKVVLGAIAAVGVAASILAHPVSSRASDAPISPATGSSPALSSRDVFAQVFAQSNASRKSIHDSQEMSRVEDAIAAAQPGFFDRFGRDIASGRPDRVKSALESGSALLQALGHGGHGASQAASVASLDALVRIGIIDATNDEIGPYIAAALASDSPFSREHVVADIAHRYVGRVAQK
jgi:hypothetical protein